MPKIQGDAAYPVESCGACLAIANRFGVQLGDSVQLRAGITGEIISIHHNYVTRGVGVLVSSHNETIVLPLQAVRKEGK